MTPTEMFERIGRALTMGRDRRSALAAALDIRPDSVRHLSSGRMPLRAGHFQDLLAAIVAQREELARVEQELREWLAKQPEEEERKTDAP
jgi:hypothetical protein